MVLIDVLEGGSELAVALRVETLPFHAGPGPGGKDRHGFVTFRWLRKLRVAQGSSRRGDSTSAPVTDFQGP